MRQLLFAFACLPLLASAADDGRVSFLEQEVRELKRQVLALSREVDELRTRPAQPGARVPAVGTPTAGRSDPGRWVNATKWRALRAGMSELEVVEALGPPSTMREENGARVLRYAMEIGASGFLSGSVTVRDRAVISFEKPTLQ